jgi:hypothetical protein
MDLSSSTDFDSLEKTPLILPALNKHDYRHRFSTCILAVTAANLWFRQYHRQTGSSSKTGLLPHRPRSGQNFTEGAIVRFRTKRRRAIRRLIGPKLLTKWVALALMERNVSSAQTGVDGR